MEPAAEVRLPQPFVKTSRLLSVPSELRIQIYHQIFHGLEARLVHPCDYGAYSTLVALSRVCRTFLVEARPLFLRTVTFFGHANRSLFVALSELSLGDCLLIRKFTVLVSEKYSKDCSFLPYILPNIEQFNISLTPCHFEYLDIKSAMKSKDTVVITDSKAKYDKERRIGSNKLFDDSEDWVRDFAIDHASGNKQHKFKLLIRLDLINIPEYVGRRTTMACEIDVVSRISTIEIPGRESRLLKLPVLIGKGLHPNAICEAAI